MLSQLFQIILRTSATGLQGVWLYW